MGILNRDKPTPSWEEGAVDAKIQAAQAAAESQSETAMPTPLLRSIFTQGLCSAAIVIVCSALAIATHHASYLVGFVFAAYLAYSAVNLSFDYKHGLIHQRVLLCSSVNRTFAGRQIIMQDVQEDPIKIYEFYLSKKATCPFIESGVYLIYTHDKDPHRIVSWMQV